MAPSRNSWRAESSLALLSLCVLLLGACGSSRSPTAPTPAADFASQFDSLWSNFDREYAYFVHKQIDWNAMKATYRPMALAAGDQAAFIEVIRQMLANLHDLHVVIRDPSGRTAPTYQPQRFINWDRATWERYIARAGWASWSSTSGVGVLDDVPYFTFGQWSSASLSASTFDTALERFRGAPLMIVDVRMNGGGDESIARDFAGRFIPRSVTAGYARFRNGPLHTDFGPIQRRTYESRGSWQFGGRVLLLIGRMCASSNESFIEAMRQLPNVTLAGDRTIGASGNPGTFPLANGWSYTISRWVDYTADNRVLEDNGIAPAVPVVATSADFAQFRDPVLDWALAQK
jgi:hypothetical protein